MKPLVKQTKIYKKEFDNLMHSYGYSINKLSCVKTFPDANHLMMFRSWYENKDKNIAYYQIVSATCFHAFDFLYRSDLPILEWNEHVSNFSCNIGMPNENTLGSWFNSREPWILKVENLENSNQISIEMKNQISGFLNDTAKFSDINIYYNNILKSVESNKSLTHARILVSYLVGSHVLNQKENINHAMELIHLRMAENDRSKIYLINMLKKIHTKFGS